MSESKTVVQRNGMTALGLLGVVFVTLKLLGITAVATWSWWLVLMPFYISLAIFLTVLLTVALVGGLVVGVATLLNK